MAVGALDLTTPFPGPVVDPASSTSVSFDWYVALGDHVKPGASIMVVDWDQALGAEQLIAGFAHAPIPPFFVADEYGIQGISAGNVSLDVSSLNVSGGYRLVLLDALGYVTTSVDFAVGVSTVFDVAGIDGLFPYAPGANVTFQWNSTLVLDPGYVQLRDYATDLVVLVEVEVDGPSGRSLLVLPEDTPLGYYDFYVCDGRDVCGYAHATLVVGEISVQGLDLDAPTPPGPLALTYNTSGLLLPLNVLLISYADESFRVTFPGESLDAIGSEAPDLEGVALGPYYVRVCDALSLVCFHLGDPHAAGAFPLITIGVFSVSGVRDTYARYADLSFAWSTAGATLPLGISVSSAGAETGVRHFAADAAAGAGVLPLSGLYAGTYALRLCDALSFCVTHPPFYYGVFSLGPVSNVSGFDLGKVYAPASPFSAHYTSVGMLLPLTLELRSYFNSSAGNSTAGNSTEATALWVLDGEVGTLDAMLPETLPHSYYGAC